MNTAQYSEFTMNDYAYQRACWIWTLLGQAAFVCVWTWTLAGWIIMFIVATK